MVSNFRDITGSLSLAHSLAIRFHDTYERLAPEFGYETRPDTKQFDPDPPNGRLMIAVCGELLPQISPVHTVSINGIHPAPAEFDANELGLDPILQFFHYTHLPAALQSTSAIFCGLARIMIDTLPRNAERTAALRKLLEAKDCAVRANVGALKPREPETFLDRLRRERDDLGKKTVTLAEFLDNGAPGVSDAQSNMLAEQHRYMTAYLEILDRRLADLDPPASELDREFPVEPEPVTTGTEHSDDPPFGS